MRQSSLYHRRLVPLRLVWFGASKFSGNLGLVILVLPCGDAGFHLISYYEMSSMVCLPPYNDLKLHFFQFSIIHLSNSSTDIDTVIKITVESVNLDVKFFSICLMQPRKIWRDACKIVVGGEPSQDTRTILVI